MSENLDVKVTFPQYAAVWTDNRDGFNVTLTARCPLCDKVVTERTWVRLDESPIDNDLLHKQSKEDGTTFGDHLEFVHHV